MKPSLTKPTFHKSGTFRPIPRHKDNSPRTLSQTAAVAIQICLRIAEDTCTELFNDPYIRAADRKADMLTAYGIFADMDKKLRQAFGKHDNDAIASAICQLADEMEHSVTAVNNAFLTETVKNFDITHAKPLAKTLTLTSVIRFADELFSSSCGIRSRMIQQLSETIESFANHVRVRPLGNTLPNINTEPASRCMELFSKTLVNKAASLNFIES